MSFWNRPFFPEFCSDATLDDSQTYDTLVRIGGSWVTECNTRIIGPTASDRLTIGSSVFAAH